MSVFPQKNSTACLIQAHSNRKFALERSGIADFDISPIPGSRKKPWACSRCSVSASVSAARRKKLRSPATLPQPDSPFCASIAWPPKHLSAFCAHPGAYCLTCIYVKTVAIMFKKINGLTACTRASSVNRKFTCPASSAACNHGDDRTYKICLTELIH